MAQQQCAWLISGIGPPAHRAHAHTYGHRIFGRHANAGDEERETRDGEDDVEVRKMAQYRARILKSDIHEFGLHPRCPKCHAYRADNGKHYNVSNHTEPCRLRFYKVMEERENKKRLSEQPDESAEHATLHDAHDLDSYVQR